ncbi:MAG: hypothetical protein H7281_07925 [Bacteriovorax sp.]|nr:hypothetical protein [Bacteriovorax sp.]
MRILILSLSLLLIATACSSKKTRTEVNQEIAQAPAAKSESELYLIETNILMNSDKLTEEQKSKLSSLIQKMRAQNLAINNEIMKTKAVLFQTLVDKEDGKLKLGVLENQLIKLNRQKVRYSLSGYREAKNIVGKSDVPLDKTLKMIDNRTIYEF